MANFICGFSVISRKVIGIKSLVHDVAPFNMLYLSFVFYLDSSLVKKEIQVSAFADKI